MSENSNKSNFIRQIIDQDLESGKHSEIVTRFPPEPNGHLHIGHAKSICLNFGIAEDYEGTCFLRFDDTNPVKEDPEFVAGIMFDVRWLGYDWGENLTHASDYFEQLYLYAVELIKSGKAFVCSLSAKEIRETRGTLTEPGHESPNRNQSIENNLDLFERMRAGEFKDGEHVLRAKIDMASPNLNMRDPAVYRIRHHSHQRTGNQWCIYPMYDFTHCLSDALEGITHSLCTLEFEDHRPLYDWFLDNVSTTCHPRQIEFSRLALDYTIMSKRLLTQLVEDKLVDDWDDPRMPTISGLRRRGYTPASLRDFCDRIGITKKDQVIEMGVLENCIREDLDPIAPRVMGVLRPLKITIENYPEDQSEELIAQNHPAKPELGTRQVPFSREIYVERDDFMEDPPRKFFRLGPGREVRLRYAYLITCVQVIKDPVTGEVLELICRYDPASRGGNAPDGRKVKGTLHWVSAHHAIDAEVRLYDRLFSAPNPGAEKDRDFTELLNPNSLEALPNCKLEPGLAKATPETRYQFERLGYFVADAVDTNPSKQVFNRVVTLRDTWARLERQGRHSHKG